MDHDDEAHCDEDGELRPVLSCVGFSFSGLCLRLLCGVTKLQLVPSAQRRVTVRTRPRPLRHAATSDLGPRGQTIGIMPAQMPMNCLLRLPEGARSAAQGVAVPSLR